MGDFDHLNELLSWKNHGVPAEHVNIAALSAVRVNVRGGSQI